MRLAVTRKQTEPGVITLTLQGPLDGETCLLLDREVSSAMATPLRTMVLDMAGVNFVTSAGIGTIMKARTSLARKQANLAMVGIQPQVRRVFEIIRVLPTMQVFRDRAELDEYLGTIQRQMTGQEEDKPPWTSFPE
jgi:anti-anti-sigma factor